MRAPSDSVAVWFGHGDGVPMWAGPLDDLLTECASNFDAESIVQIRSAIERGQVFEGAAGRRGVWVRVQPHYGSDHFPELPVVRYPVNHKGRDFVVGDVHGEFDAVRRWMRGVRFEPSADRLFSVGDLIDRGPSSHEADWWVQQSWFHAVRGNHEHMLLNAMYAPCQANVAVWMRNGGEWFIQQPRERREAITEALADLPYAIEIASVGGGRIGIVHGDFPVDGVSWSEFLSSIRDWTKVAVWGRRLARCIKSGGAPSVSGVDLLVLGHTPQPKAAFAGNVALIDTGMGASNSLSFLSLQDAAVTTAAI